MTRTRRRTRAAPPGSTAPPPGSPFDQTGRKTPMPALINITIPAGTLLGWSGAPADVGSWGLMDAETARDLIEAASRHPRTRWCYTLTGQGGEAIAHACARGSHPWRPPQASRDGPVGPRPVQLAELLAELNAAPEPIAQGTCDHRHLEHRYIPSRKLKHLIRARTARCCAPGCGAQAITSEIDHTIPYPAGATCECNLGPRVPAPPPRQARTRLETRADRARRHALDHALGPDLHHPPHPIRRITMVEKPETCKVSLPQFHQARELPHASSRTLRVY